MGDPEKRKERSMGGRSGGGDREASATMRGPMVGLERQKWEGQEGAFPPPSTQVSATTEDSPPALPSPPPSHPRPRRARDH